MPNNTIPANDARRPFIVLLFAFLIRRLYSKLAWWPSPSIHSSCAGLSFLSKDLCRQSTLGIIAILLTHNNNNLIFPSSQCSWFLANLPPSRSEFYSASASSSSVTIQCCTLLLCSQSIDIWRIEWKPGIAMVQMQWCGKFKDICHWRMTQK